MKNNIRMVLRLATMAMLAAGLAACGERPGSLMLRPVAAAGVGTPVSVLVATTRQRSTAEQYVFTDSRSQSLNYERYDLSIPPTHVPGKIEWPDHPPGDPARNFVVTQTRG